MPRFKWRGVTIAGAWQRGVAYASSADQLDEQLFRRGIACTYLTEHRVRIWRRSVPYRDQVALFNRLSVLLYAGVRVPDAWILVAQHSSRAYLQDYAHSVAIALQNGMALREALCHMRSPFSPMILSLLHVGYESGQLAKSVDAISRYLEVVRLFYADLHAVLFMPCITLVFVIILTIGIFVYVIPYLLSLFSSFHAELPPTTMMVIRISSFMHSWYPIIIIGISGMLAIGVRYLIAHFPSYKRRWDRCTMHTPFIGPLVQDWYTANFMRALECLLEGGMNLPQALHLMQNTVRNCIVHDDCMLVANLVDGGVLLSDALSSTRSGIFKSDLIAMIAIGEESNNLPHFLTKTAEMYHEKLATKLNRLAILMQPLVVIMLGAIVMLLIISVYMPILQMAHHI